MGIKKLKKENDYLNLTIADMISKFDPSKTKKYTQFLVKLITNRIKDQIDSSYHPEFEYEKRPVENLVPMDSIENFITRQFVCDHLFSWHQMDTFVEFCQLMDRGLTNEKDISKYNSWEMLETELFAAKNKASIKKAEKEILIIPSDERYLIFKPLTYLASTTYGYQTKWCTAMINDPMYFYSHSRGILIYLIDRETNKRFAFHKIISEPYDLEDHEDLIFTTWNEQDKKIDTIQTGLPVEILKIILDQMDTKNSNNVANYKHFSSEELRSMANYVDFPGVDQYRENFGLLKEEQPTEERLVPPTPTNRRARLIPIGTELQTIAATIRTENDPPISVEFKMEDFTDYFSPKTYEDELP